MTEQTDAGVSAVLPMSMVCALRLVVVSRLVVPVALGAFDD